MGNHLDKIRSHSVRLYVTAKEMKKQGLDWKAALTESWTTDKQQASVEDIFLKIASDKNLSVAEQIEAFEKATGLKRRSFFNYKKKLLPMEASPATGA